MLHFSWANMFTLFYSTFTSEYVCAVLCYFCRANVFALFMVLSRANMFTLFYVILLVRMCLRCLWYFHERICLRSFMLFFSSECVCAVHGTFTSECVYAVLCYFFSSECVFAVYYTFTSEYVCAVLCYFPRANVFALFHDTFYASRGFNTTRCYNCRKTGHRIANCPALKVPMKWKIICAYLKGLSKYRGMVCFFLKYLFSF